ncbi:hypothetical protein WEI85_36470 [Actinomycetes bacterium KLBMP 9797]
MNYTEAIGRLADAYAAVDARRTEAEEWYARQVAAAARAEREAAAALAAAEAELTAAQAFVDRIDREAEELWRTTVRRLGAPASRHGGPPGPAPLTADEAYHPDQQLELARGLVDKYWRPTAMPRSLYPMLLFLSAIGAGVAFALRETAVWAGERWGGDLAVGLPVLALVVTLIGPFAGLWPAKVVADRRHVTLDVTTLVAVVATGAATITLLILILP